MLFDVEHNRNRSGPFCLKTASPATSFGELQRFANNPHKQRVAIDSIFQTRMLGLLHNIKIGTGI